MSMTTQHAKAMKIKQSALDLRSISIKILSLMPSEFIISKARRFTLFRTSSCTANYYII